MLHIITTCFPFMKTLQTIYFTDLNKYSELFSLVIGRLMYKYCSEILKVSRPVDDPITAVPSLFAGRVLKPPSLKLRFQFPSNVNGCCNFEVISIWVQNRLYL